MKFYMGLMTFLVIYFSFQTWALTRSKDCQTTWYGKIADTVGVGGLIASVVGLVIGLFIVLPAPAKPAIILLMGIVATMVFSTMIATTRECNKGKSVGPATAAIYISDSVGLIISVLAILAGIAMFTPTGQVYLRAVSMGAAKLGAVKSALGKAGAMAQQASGQLQNLSDAAAGLGKASEVLYY